MRRLFLALPLLFALGCDSGPREGEGPRREAGSEGTVTRVVDGDTLHVDRAGKDVTVRLLRVNTRERAEWGYKQGQTTLRKWVEGKRVRLEGEGETKDRYGRSLAYVFVGDANVNLEMVRSGWSPFYVRYGKGRYAAAFVAAETEARRAKRGLWARPEEARRNEKRR